MLNFTLRPLYPREIIPVDCNLDPSDRAVYGHSPAGIAGSNPAEGMDVCVVQWGQKGKSQDSPDKETSTDRGQRKNKKIKKKIRLGSCMSIACECCVCSGREFCDGPITRTEESYWLWCVIFCGLETSSPCPLWAVGPQKNTVTLRLTCCVTFCTREVFVCFVWLLR